MRKLFCLAAVAAVALFVAEVDARAKAAKSIKAVMGEGFKGDKALCAKASSGKATKDEVNQLVALVEDMSQGTPKKGDQKVWKEKCDVLLSAAKKLADNPADPAAVKAFGAAANCKACHSQYK